MFWDTSGFMCLNCKQDGFMLDEISEHNLCSACASKPEVVKKRREEIASLKEKTEKEKEERERILSAKHKIDVYSHQFTLDEVDKAFLGYVERNTKVEGIVDYNVFLSINLSKIWTEYIFECEGVDAAIEFDAFSVNDAKDNDVSVHINVYTYPSKIKEWIKNPTLFKKMLEEGRYQCDINLKIKVK